MEKLRYERKFFVTDTSQSEVAMYVKVHPALFTEAYPARRVNNIYFDTLDFSHYRTHVNGSSQRSKIRLRWYGEERESEHEPVLEIKRRVGMVGYKERYELASLPAAVWVVWRQMRPVLMNHYWRSYWVSSDKRWRLTIDSDMHFSRWSGERFGGEVAARGAVVVELKYDVADGEDSARVGQYWPWRATRYSKYVAGVGQLW